MVGIAPVGLRSSPRAHFNAVRLLFCKHEAESLPSTPPPDAVSLLPLSFQPVGWWSEHRAFFRFALVNFSSFSLVDGVFPKFPISALGDDSFRPTFYAFDHSSLLLYIRGEWRTLVRFTSDELNCATFLSFPSYFAFSKNI